MWNLIELFVAWLRRRKLVNTQCGMNRNSALTVGICRHDMLIRIELKCGHSFCCGCLEEYLKVWVIRNITDQTKSKCPLCCNEIVKKNIDNVVYLLSVKSSFLIMF